jgi:hypothetical protein
MRPYLKKKITHKKKRAGGGAQGEGPEFKPPVLEKEKKKFFVPMYILCMYVHMYIYK